MIDEDKNMFISLINEIKETGKYDFDNMPEDEEMSFFHDAGNDMIREYSFSTPKELYEQLTSLWIQLESADFHRLTEVLIVLAFKHRKNIISSESISSYLYEM